MAIAPAASDSADSSPPTLSPDQLPLLNRPRIAAAGPAPDLRTQVYQKWIDAGATPQGADAILRRIGVESGFNPNAVGDNGTSFNIYQHHADRAQRLAAYAASQCKPANDPLVATDFAIKEVTQGLDPIAAAHAREILSGSDPNAFTRYFERPAGSSAAGGGSTDFSSLARAGETVRQSMYDLAGKETARAREAIEKIGKMEPEISKSMGEIRKAREQADLSQSKALASLEKQPKPPEIDGVEKMGGVATIVGILGGLLTRQPLIASLNAAGAAIGAYNDGDRERYKLAFDNWKTQNDLLFKIAEMQATRVHDIMSDEKFGLEERRTVLDLTLRAMGQQNLADEIRVKGDQAGAEWQLKIENAQRQKQQLDLQLEEYRDRHEAEMARDPAATAFRQWRTEFSKKEGREPTREELSAAWGQAKKDFPKETAARAPQILYDTKKDAEGNPIPYVYDPYEKKATTLTGEPYTPTGAAKLSSSRQQSADVLMTDDEAKIAAEQYLAGDRSAIQGWGRGAQGDSNRVKIRKFITEIAKDRGMGGAEIAARIAEFEGIKAAERTLGTREAGLGVGLAEARQFVPLGIAASERVDRTQFPTINSVLQAYYRGTGDENIVRLGQATASLIGAYSQVLTRGGMPTDAARKMASDIIETNYSKNQFLAGADQMMREIESAERSPELVRQRIREALVKGQPPVPLSPVAPGQNVPTGDAIRYLLQHPDTRDHYDEMFGPSAAARILGH